MIPIGKRCEECSKIHVIKSMEEFERLSPQIKAKAYRSEHRVFRDGYFLSLNVNDEIWEIYVALSTLRIERIQEKELEEEKTTIEKLIEEYYEVEEEEDL
jgi:hypothetical protein